MWNGRIHQLQIWKPGTQARDRVSAKALRQECRPEFQDQKEGPLELDLIFGSALVLLRAQATSAWDAPASPQVLPPWSLQLSPLAPAFAACLRAR